VKTISKYCTAVQYLVPLWYCISKLRLKFSQSILASASKTIDKASVVRQAHDELHIVKLGCMTLSSDEEMKARISITAHD
jgi:hypothetical protein